MMKNYLFNCIIHTACWTILQIWKEAHFILNSETLITIVMLLHSKVDSRKQIIPWFVVDTKSTRSLNMKKIVSGGMTSACSEEIGSRPVDTMNILSTEIWGQSIPGIYRLSFITSKVQCVLCMQGNDYFEQDVAPVIISYVQKKTCSVNRKEPLIPRAFLKCYWIVCLLKSYGPLADMVIWSQTVKTVVASICVSCMRNTTWKSPSTILHPVTLPDGPVVVHPFNAER